MELKTVNFCFMDFLARSGLANTYNVHVAGTIQDTRLVCATYNSASCFRHDSLGSIVRNHGCVNLLLRVMFLLNFILDIHKNSVGK